jgi:thiamine-monophosphate kinase
MTNEFELLEQIRSRLGRRGDRVLRGSGDDAAVTRADGLSVTSVDVFVETVHFRLDTTSLRDLGHKCLAASLSDLAAMAAEPGEAYIAIGLPEKVEPAELLELVDGAEALAKEVGVTICGGDLTRSGELFVAVTTVGHAARESALVGRDGARSGDLIGVTGALGGAGAALLLLERKLSGEPSADPSGSQPEGRHVDALLARQLRPQPRLEAGRALARAGVRAMIDLSDGVASDAARIAERSDVMIEVRLDRLPLEEGVGAVAEAAGLEAVALAAEAGEDYELLFAAPESAASGIESAVGGVGLPVTWIGRVKGVGAGVRLLDEAGEPRSLRGWDHFRARGPGIRLGRASR